MTRQTFPKTRRPEPRPVATPLVNRDPEITPRVATLLEMLTYKRPAYSPTEAAFIARYLTPLGIQRDDGGNLWLQIGNSPILWSSHTDTVHKQDGRQTIEYGDGVVTASRSNCLGADCTVGVWIMREMIQAGIPGTYVFHAAEEIGGIGSDWIAQNTPDRLANIQFAIAFDRMGTTEIITHQVSQRCASDAFAHSLASILRPLKYQPSDGGTFTDTANYADIIPECANLAVGYYRQHRSDEWQDVRHACALLDTLLVADWSRLTCERDPTVWELDDWASEQRGPSYDLTRLVKERPQLVADFLEACGFTEADVLDFDWRRYPN